MIDEIGVNLAILTAIDSHEKLAIIRKKHKEMDTETILWGLEKLDKAMVGLIGTAIDLACHANNKDRKTLSNDIKSMPYFIEKELEKPQSKYEFIRLLKKESPEARKEFLANLREFTDRIQ